MPAKRRTTKKKENNDQTSPLKLKKLTKTTKNQKNIEEQQQQRPTSTAKIIRQLKPVNTRRLPDVHDSAAEIAELKQMIRELKEQKTPPARKERKLSAVNKFKKYVLSNVTEKALADTDYSDLIAVDKMRLLNKAYPIVWNKLVLEPLYQQNNISSPEQQTMYSNQRNILRDYHSKVDEIINQVKNGPLDDRQHTLEDIQSLMISAIKTAAQEFGSPEDEDEYENEEVVEEEN